jgi:hypothetical protein
VAQLLAQQQDTVPALPERRPSFGTPVIDHRMRPLRRYYDAPASKDREENCGVFCVPCSRTRLFGEVIVQIQERTESIGL